MTKYIGITNYEREPQNVILGDDFHNILKDLLDEIPYDTIDNLGHEPKTIEDYAWCYDNMLEDPVDWEISYHLLRNNGKGKFETINSAVDELKALAIAGGLASVVEEVEDEKDLEEKADKEETVTEPQKKRTKNFGQNMIATGITVNGIEVEGRILGIGSTTITIKDSQGKFHTIEKRTAYVEE